MCSSDLGWSDTRALAQALATWRRRGYNDVRAMRVGGTFGLGGRVLDNRERRVITPVASRAAAKRVIRQVYERYDVRASARARLLERPWAKLRVFVGDAALGWATSYVRVQPQGGAVEVADVQYGVGYSWEGRATRSYHGEIYAAVDADGTLAAVNVVGVERILAGVVPSEIFASAPLAALEAQSVAARNHLLARLGKRHHADPYHLCSAQHCQVYGGLSKEDPRTTRAVMNTAGKALFLGGHLVDSVYSSTCGGHTEDNDAVWGDAPKRALRGQSDLLPNADAGFLAAEGGIARSAIEAWVHAEPRAYCSEASVAAQNKFRWQRRFTRAELTRIIRENHPEIGALRDVHIQKRGRGGRAIALRLVGERDTALVLHELPIRRLFDNLNSGAFVLERELSDDGTLEALRFVGGGWGHGVGMCQLGAIGRAEAGHSYAQILSHYYNGARVEQLYGPPPEQAATRPPQHSP